MKTINPKKMIQRRRKMLYFIEAAEQIISEKGMDALTIRGVSEIAGYNSATLYSYFSNLDHLIYYTHMKYIIELDQLLRPAFDHGVSPAKSLRDAWKIFCKYSYENTSEVYTLMLSPYSIDFKNVWDDYKKIYKGKNRVEAYRDKKVLFKDSVFDVIVSKLKTVEQGLNLNRDEMSELNTFIQTYFQGQLVRKMTFESGVSQETYIERMVRFMDRIISFYRRSHDFKGVI